MKINLKNKCINRERKKKEKSKREKFIRDINGAR